MIIQSILCFFGNHSWGEKQEVISGKPFCDCKHCPSWKSLETNHITQCI